MGEHLEIYLAIGARLCTYFGHIALVVHPGSVLQSHCLSTIYHIPIKLLGELGVSFSTSRTNTQTTSTGCALLLLHCYIGLAIYALD